MLELDAHRATVAFHKHPEIAVGLSSLHDPKAVGEAGCAEVGPYPNSAMALLHTLSAVKPYWRITTSPGADAP